MTEQRSNRVIEIDRANLDDYQQRVIARLQSGRGKVLTPYKIWIHSAGVADGMEVLGTHLNTASSFDEAELEIGILMTAVFWGSPFVINAHTRHSRKAGIDDAAIEQMLARAPASFADKRRQAVHDLVNDALAGGSIEDEAYRAYEGVLGRKGIAELIALVGYYTSVAIGMWMHEVLPAAQ
ncbi:carboxymuconolactone decarboxylase [Rhizobium sp. 1AS11]|uniref:carboxymuconolactone decarboxylase family protein n=1 Tax=Rhizobium acaciae TaxID=2989736 RepID=UPI0022222FA6|nr:carboxymuconolactone decarboxylase [Rhizobium acaciae]MCW1411313.1 carboxymuconolactone decarboxylase [Rhizobium acaciae]MCW1743275.1 carboxymuconolactone decarboxylase [Rhizobium acaciae]